MSYATPVCPHDWSSLHKIPCPKCKEAKATVDKFYETTDSGDENDRPAVVDPGPAVGRLVPRFDASDRLSREELDAALIHDDFRPADVKATENEEIFAAVRGRRRLLETTSEKRKAFPIAEGLLDYFPDACAAVAEVSYLGNEKHNPGEPMHWARGKSMDHANCIGRHLIERGGFDGRIRHSAALAWRAMALLQQELEEDLGLWLPRGAS